MSGTTYQRTLTALALLVAMPTAAAAQQASPRYEDHPTAGVDLPTTGLAGEHDALSVSANPAGLVFLGGWHVALAVDSAEPDEDKATAPGPGFGMFAAGAVGGGLLPRLGWGVGLEFLRPPRDALLPDPGTPTRLSWAGALPLGRNLAVGLAWRHFFDGPGRVAS